MKRSLLALLLTTACAPSGDPREATVVQSLARFDEVLIRTRPALAAGKFNRMAGNPYDFFRGALPLFRTDWEAGAVSQSSFRFQTQPVLGLGDPHPENFGLLLDAQGVLALEPNDFDSADRVPYLFDLRRLIIGLGVAARRQNANADLERISRATAKAYAETFMALADQTQSPERITTDLGVPVLEDLFKRGERDLAARAELELTEVTDQGRRFIRTESLTDVSGPIRASLEPVLAPLNQPIVDVVREYDSGVASWPRVRFLVLLGDERIVEIKELAESALAGWYRPAFVARDTPARVDAAIRRSWAIPRADPRWFTAAWTDVPVQVRTEAESNKGINVDRWAGARATDDSLESLGTTLGALLARVHTRSDTETLRSIQVQLARGIDAFAAEQANLATTEVDQLFADYARFKTALEDLGPTLGITPDVRDLPSSPGAALFDPPSGTSP